MNNKTKELLKKNNALEKQLSPQAAAVMTDLIVYIRGANISDYHQESVRYDLLQMIIDGETRGDTIDDIIGEDTQTFCDEVLLEVPQLSTKERILSMVSLCCLCLSILSFIWLIYMGINVIKGNVTLPYLPVTNGQLLSAFLIIVVAIRLYYYVTNTSFDHNALHNKAIYIVFFLFMLATILLNTFMTMILLTLHIVVIPIMILALFILYRVIDRNLTC